MSLEELLISRIEESGPISIAEYMALALAHPEYGYYMRKDPFGVQGDFTTAPEVSQIFGELIGAWLAMQWIIMGKPKEAALVELGPGRGTLMDDILRATRGIKGFHDALSVHMMEISQTLRNKQFETLENKHPRITWHTGFGEIPQKPLLLVANEFFDALPVRQLLHTKTGWHERMVALDKNDKLVFTWQKEPPPPILEDAPVSTKPYEYSEAATQMGLVIANRIFQHGGAALMIDYGYAGNHHGDSLQAVKKHKPHDFLSDPGSADLTAHVDFHNLTKAGAIGGCTTYGPVSQRHFLNTIGARERTEELAKAESTTDEQREFILSGLLRLTGETQMGELFKVLCFVHPDMPKPEGF